MRSSELRCWNTPAGHMRKAYLIAALSVTIHVTAPIRKATAEDRLDFKYMYYQETDGRMQILAPTLLYEKDLSDTLTIRIDGIYNAISGATPTGAPPEARTVTTTTTTRRSSGGSTTSAASAPAADDNDPGHDPDDDDDDNDADDDDLDKGRGGAGFHAKAGATQTPSTGTGTPASTTSAATSTSSGSGSSDEETRTDSTTEDGEIPTTDVDDTRVGLNVELLKRIGRHTASGKLSFSTEEDYTSLGLAFRDAIDFNDKNTTLTLGAAYTYDRIDLLYESGQEARDTVDVMVGLTQLLGPRTLLIANLAVGRMDGYLSDPYKVVELNGEIVSEVRPDSKTKEILYLSWLHYFDALHAAADVGYRYYNDSFGVTGHTVSLAWRQKMGRHFVFQPFMRYYDQSAADFFGVRFSGSPSDYSSDCRLSALTATSLGAKLIWRPADRFAFDLSYESYEQQGKDSAVADDFYPKADIVTIGGRISL